MSATYTFDVFSSLDGYGSYGGDGDWGGYWGKQGSELLDHRLASFDTEQRMVFGATTFRQFVDMIGTSTEESDVRGARGRGRLRPRAARAPHPRRRHPGARLPAHPARRPALIGPRTGRRTTMSNLTIDVIMSLDGYGAAEGWPGYWGLEGPEYLASIESTDEHVALLGATTYRLMSGFADALHDDPGFAALTATRKVVFSSTLTSPLTWENSELAGGDAIAAVRDMKRDGSTPLRTIGSLSLGRSLLRAGLVDRFRVVVFPVVTGVTGRDRIFDSYPDVTLDLVESRTFDGRLQLLEYVPTVLDGPPAAP